MSARSPKRPERDSRKQSLYLPDAMLAFLHAQGARTERSLSWLVQFAVRAARAEIEALPAVTLPRTP